MRIIDLLDKRSIDISGKAKDKHDALTKMVDLMAESGKINDKQAYFDGVQRREEESTTGVGEGVAIPHCKSDAVNNPGLAAMVLPDGVDFDSLDGEPVHLIFLIAAPNTKDNVHLDVLSELSMLLMDEEFTGRLRNAKSVDEFLAIIEQAQTDRDSDQEPDRDKELEQSQESRATEGMDRTVRILAVTGCPTGIAHTFMAAEALDRAAKKVGISIKVETRGSGGAKNVLTDQEIAEADGIIVAADTQVPMERFHGKKLIEVPVSDGISKPDQLLERIIEGRASVYHSSSGTDDSSNSDQYDKNDRENNRSIGHQFYKHLMNGVSHMLPFVVAGGIMIAIAFLLDDKTIDPSNFGMNTPVAAWFKSIGGYAFNFMLPILAGYIAMSIADRPGLLVGFVGGYLALTGPTFTNPTADNAVSPGFLGALLAGFAAGYLVILIKKLCSFLPNALEGIKPVLLYPLLGTTAIAVVMCTVNPFISALNTGLTSFLNSMGSTSKILLGCILGGMMAIDMGGPFNKAAYVFGTGMLAQQTESGFMIMAAVMIGGMVPPTAIAIATTFFKNKFTPQERKSGPVNYLMGISFITEGAIPYAAADPLRVIPSCIVGSALAGGLSMAFRCTLQAPHGGLFVIATVGGWLGYLIAYVVGSIVGGALIGFLKKRVEIRD